MVLPSSFKPNKLNNEDIRYVIAYQSSTDSDKFYATSPVYPKVHEVLKLRPICGDANKSLNNLSVILKYWLNKKGISCKKVVYWWDNKKQCWILNEGKV